MSDPKHGYTDDFRAFASGYYDVDSAICYFDSPVPEGCYRWRCLGCGWGIDVTEEGNKMIGAVCCGGCGFTLLRPIEEWEKK